MPAGTTISSSAGAHPVREQRFPRGHPFRSVRAMPQDVALPPIWLLGSSGYSAQLAATVGAGFAFAHHFADHDAAAAMLSYRDQFGRRRHDQVPMPSSPAPGVCRQRRGGGAARVHHRSQLRAREPRRISAARVSGGGRRLHLFAGQRGLIARNRARLFVGAQSKVRAELTAMIAATKANEVMVHDHALRSRRAAALYELLADALWPPPVAASSVPRARRRPRTPAR